MANPSRDPVVKRLNFGPVSKPTKPAHVAVDNINAAIERATHSGVFHGGVTLRKAKNK